MTKKENIAVNGEEVVTGKKQQKISPSYTLKAFKGNIERMKDAKLIKEDDYKTLNEVYKRAAEHWISIGMGI